MSVPAFIVASVVLYEEILVTFRAASRIIGLVLLLCFAVFLNWKLITRCRWHTVILSVLFVSLLFAGLHAIDSVEPELQTASSNDTMRKLGALGYVDWTEPESENNLKLKGVVKHDPTRAWEGLNLYNSRSRPEAQLIDMEGKVVHEWKIRIDGGTQWRNVELCSNGDLIIIAADQMLIKLDRNSKMKWSLPMRCHHDVAIGAGGTVYALAREDEIVLWHGIPVPIIKDLVNVVSADGRLREQVSLYELAKEHVSPGRIASILKSILDPRTLGELIYQRTQGTYYLEHGTCFDVLHTNNIEIAERDIDGFCRAGDWLVSFREPDTVAVVDSRSRSIVWTWGPGEISRQHHPTILENNNILLFDNGVARGSSRIVELAPVARDVVWEYKAVPKGDFFSRARGSVQRLENGNTLITDSNKGRVFEVTPEGQAVWDFYNPETRKEDNKRAVIYRMVRVARSEGLEVLLSGGDEQSVPLEPRD